MRLIEKLKITPAEERHMRALITDAEKQSRKIARQREQRRTAGLAARAEDEALAAGRRVEIAALRRQGYGGRAIAEQLSISEREVRRLTG